MMRYDPIDLRRSILALTERETDPIALMATVACEVHHADDRFDWTGFYRVVAPELLKIGPYQGGHGCLVIPFSRGVCGAAARSGQTQRIADVGLFEDHIACSTSTRSELVVPVFGSSGALLAVFDIDSDQPNAFDESDAVFFEDLLKKVFALVTSG